MRALKTTAGVLLASAAMASAQFNTNWVAFNDHNRSLSNAPMTGLNVSTYHLGAAPGGVLTSTGGPLTNYLDGQQLAATLIVTATGGIPDDFGLCMDANMGTPAYNLFNGIVDVGGAVGIATPNSDEGIIGLRNVDDVGGVTTGQRGHRAVAMGALNGEDVAAGSIAQVDI